MLFSSNRPNGKGGFDLYYTGIEKIKQYFNFTISLPLKSKICTVRWQPKIHAFGYMDIAFKISEY